MSNPYEGASKALANEIDYPILKLDKILMDYSDSILEIYDMKSARSYLYDDAVDYSLEAIFRELRERLPADVWSPLVPYLVAATSRMYKGDDDQQKEYYDNLVKEIGKENADIFLGRSYER